ncbi:uncharacterized protein MELLADRAFT_113814 [Melampsora larici-populina 98AG31]|uniref:Uncharacterized protein n=1 Tax=Melampsora larici-populina (strain 98AG31 / pathotype 3-4-7) TaxID=747676 RepID=F4SB52_MELLP|nr:uncharacterized protein MELLADRAFT_113814 [Melampsora larici-populina 98AG31]EGF98133.1 hypothetical protein MELLADRAFT_113814 [Melampsora larici-populina 98AG31]
MVHEHSGRKFYKLYKNFQSKLAAQQAQERKEEQIKRERTQAEQRAIRAASRGATVERVTMPQRQNTTFLAENQENEEEDQYGQNGDLQFLGDRNIIEEEEDEDDGDEENGEGEDDDEEEDGSDRLGEENNQVNDEAKIKKIKIQFNRRPTKENIQQDDEVEQDDRSSDTENLIDKMPRPASEKRKDKQNRQNALLEELVQAVHKGTTKEVKKASARLAKEFGISVPKTKGVERAEATAKPSSSKSSASEKTKRKTIEVITQVEASNQGGSAAAFRGKRAGNRKFQNNNKRFNDSFKNNRGFTHNNHQNFKAQYSPTINPNQFNQFQQQQYVTYPKNYQMMDPQLMQPVKQSPAPYNNGESSQNQSYQNNDQFKSYNKGAGGGNNAKNAGGNNRTKE